MYWICSAFKVCFSTRYYYMYATPSKFRWRPFFNRNFQVYIDTFCIMFKIVIANFFLGWDILTYIYIYIYFFCSQADRLTYKIFTKQDTHDLEISSPNNQTFILIAAENFTYPSHSIGNRRTDGRIIRIKEFLSFINITPLYSLRHSI